ncbi:Farnesyl diphosphate synthase [Sporosarcina pasteurii]|uniref:Farnesyl diphosphate synthase n=2 Tax=Sporosarcina pasteurii TaxID=1474 RepID=A0A380BQP7_SPOPA|nr:Farnesyl diphosphate synthase [Sporosarcina pasteurii]
MMKGKLEQFIEAHTPRINDTLHTLLMKKDIPESLQSSMLYSIHAGGKRIRPLLVLATLEDLDVHADHALEVAAAIELIHTYSLIHDDLPSMDDDDMRRGKPTNHKVYGEAMAILAGDALQTLAFETLASLPNIRPEKSIELIRLLAIASGAKGMVAGQVLDLEGEKKSLTLQDLELIHLNKTGALLTYCIEAGGILADIEAEKMKAIKVYAENIGLAFQIQDDILDVTSTTEELGKNAGSDESSEKTTYPIVLGLEGAKKQLMHHHSLAKQSLAFLEKDDSLLALFADYIVERNF